MTDTWLQNFRPKVIATKIVDGHEVKILEARYAEGALISNHVKRTSSLKNRSYEA